MLHTSFDDDGALLTTCRKGSVVEAAHPGFRLRGEATIATAIFYLIEMQ